MVWLHFTPRIKQTQVSNFKLDKRGFVRAKNLRNSHTTISKVQDNAYNGDGGIRTHVPVARQNDFESFPLRPLRYVSGTSLL